MTTGEDTHGPDYFTPVFLLPQLCNSTEEIELSALSRQCLSRRIPDIDTLNQELQAWQEVVNTEQRAVNWQFTTDDARIKLRHLYPEH